MNNKIVKAANVLVPPSKLFLSSKEIRYQKLPTGVTEYEIEIILQVPNLLLRKKGALREEVEFVNDVFTTLEHPGNRNADVEILNEKETIYVGHVRAGLIGKITVALPESGNFY